MLPGLYCTCAQSLPGELSRWNDDCYTITICPLFFVVGAKMYKTTATSAVHQLEIEGTGIQFSWMVQG